MLWRTPLSSELSAPGTPASTTKTGHRRTLPSHASYTLDAARRHFDDLQGLSGADYQARLVDFVEQDFRASQPPGDLSASATTELNGRRSWAENATSPGNVHRGNGFGGEGSSAIPEFQLFDRPPLTEGAELWKISPSGDRITIATYTNNAWRLNL